LPGVAHGNVALVVGGAGTGKTTFADRLIAANRRPRTRFWVWSLWGGYRGEYVGTAAAMRRRKSWPPVAVFDGDPADVVQLAIEAGDVNLVLDEVQIAAPAGKRLAGPGQDKRFPDGHPLWRVLYQGRHFRVFVLGITQFPMNVSVSLRESAQWVFSFRVLEPSQLQYLQARCGVQMAEKVRSHSGFAPLLWTPQTRSESP
jgi:hypothetical protein